MLQAQIELGNLPINLVLVDNSTVASVRVVREFKPIFDYGSGVDAAFYMDGFIINNDNYMYDQLYEYKLIPDMLTWLQQQNLINPF